MATTGAFQRDSVQSSEIFRVANANANGNALQRIGSVS
jgi:hypothetical protein